MVLHCNWFHASHDTGHVCLTRALAEDSDDNSEERAILCESGARQVNPALAEVTVQAVKNLGSLLVFSWPFDHTNGLKVFTLL